MKRALTVPVGLIALAALVLVVAACGGGEEKVSPGGALQAEVPGRGAEVRNFTHQDLTVPVGTRVIWTNRDLVMHTSTSGLSPSPDGVWDTGTINAGLSASITMDTVGTFPYFCTIHPTIQATVTVTE